MCRLYVDVAHVPTKFFGSISSCKILCSYVVFLGISASVRCVGRSSLRSLVIPQQGEGRILTAKVESGGKKPKMTTKYTMVLVRHGESEYNKENRFCGWFDADLSPQGVEEAKNAGKMLKEKNYTFDIAFTSVLKRAVKTLYQVQEELDLHWIPVIRHWRLNERHYGGLQGLNKSETAAKHGEAQVKIWRRSYDTPPPPLEANDPRSATNEAKYDNYDAAVVPLCECLKDTVERVLPYWHDVIVPTIKSGQKILISAHGNSLRALIKYLDNVSDDSITELNVPTGIPLVYELDADLKPVKHYYLADEAQVKAAMEKVANQGKAK